MVYPFTGKLDSTGLRIRPHAIPTSHALDQAVMALAADEALSKTAAKAAWWARAASPPHAPQTPSSRPPRAFHKPIIATDLVIGFREHSLFADLLKAYPDAYAVDMEAYGFLVATWMLEHRGLVVRGLSDNLDGKTAGGDQMWQPIAARNAAMYCFSILDQLGGEGV